MSYLLDSDWVISFLNGQFTAVQLIERLAEEGVFLSVISYGEVYEGLLSRPSQSVHLAQLDQFTAIVELVTLDISTAHLYASSRSVLRSQGLLIPDNDLWIAATALAHDLTLVSRDQHFSRVPGLELYPAS